MDFQTTHTVYPFIIYTQAAEDRGPAGRGGGGDGSHQAAEHGALQREQVWRTESVYIRAESTEATELQI